MPTWAWVLIGLASGLVTLYILAVLTAFIVGIKAAKDIVKSQEAIVKSQEASERAELWDETMSNWERRDADNH